MEVCSKVHIPVFSDIIVVEFALNDEPNPSPPMDNAPRRSFEKLLRKLLAYPNKPAVIVLNAFKWFKVGAGGVSVARRVACHSQPYMCEVAALFLQFALLTT